MLSRRIFSTSRARLLALSPNRVRRSLVLSSMARSGARGLLNVSQSMRFISASSLIACWRYLSRTSLVMVVSFLMILPRRAADLNQARTLVMVLLLMILHLSGVFSSSRSCDMCIFFNARDEISFLFLISSKKEIKPHLVFWLLVNERFRTRIYSTRQRKLILLIPFCSY